ncbi:MAG: NAD(P)/FAD-dependent oxidoreductase [Pseudomonadota bacterium]
MPAIEHFGVVVVGAGISCIGAACQLKERCPDRSFVVLERRERLGGTWDLFRYPGIRSDSDMHTLGFRFKPWNAQKAIADGPAILDYLQDTSAEHDIDPHIRFGHSVAHAAWSTAEARWTLTVARTGSEAPVTLTCDFLFMCSGYYDYQDGYTPEFPGLDRFSGPIVHPQHWPASIDLAGRRVVVIGSGATAVTLVPELAKKATHVSMLQRSPTYIVNLPSEDRIANTLRRWLGDRIAYFLTRWKNVLLARLFFDLSQRFPAMMKKLIRRGVRRELGKNYPVDEHFAPDYKPWDQRVCVVPDADLFDAIRSGSASVVTDHIDTFTETGVRLRSGSTLEADVIVTATGLVLQVFGGMTVTIDGSEFSPPDTMCYKAMMFSDVPNLAISFGYTNASWTLKADLTSEYVCRVLNHMSRQGYRCATPRQRDASATEEPFLRFTSGYVQRALPILPKQGAHWPWRLYENYLLDMLRIRYGRVDDGVMEFR